MSQLFSHTPGTLGEYTAKSVNIHALFMIEEPGIENVYTRPFKAEADYGMINQIMPHIADLTIPDVAGAVGAYIRPDMHSTYIAPINNGWGTSRFRWTMQVESVNNFGVSSLIMLDGWTDYSDQSLSGLVDPNMVFRINSVTETRVGNPAVQAPVPLTAVSGNTSVFRLPDAEIAPGRLYLQRPGDIQSAGATATILNNSGGGQFGLDTNALSLLTGAADTDNRLHASSARYGYDLLESVRYAATSGEDNDAYSTREIRRRLRPATLLRNPFIAVLSARMSNTSNIDTGSFTLKDLINLDPTLQTRMVVQKNTNVIQYHTNTDTSAAAQISMMYAQAVPAYMAQHAVQKLEFIQDQQGCVYITGLGSVIQDRDMSLMRRSLETSLKNELYISASYNHTLPFMIKVMCLLYGNITISLVDDMGHEHVYSYPAYASSAYAPQITTDLTGFMNLSGTFHDMMQEVAQNTTGQVLY